MVRQVAMDWCHNWYRAIYVTLLFAAFLAVPGRARAEDLFKCPEQFGYFADTVDCSKYFVCVFGDALHESCTGGLYFSAELQTCDWPRNVQCATGETPTNKSKEAPPADHAFDSSRHRLNSSAVTAGHNQLSSLDNRSGPAESRPATAPTTGGPAATTSPAYPSAGDDRKGLDAEEGGGYPSPSADDNDSYEPQAPVFDEAAPPYVDSDGIIFVADGPSKTVADVQRLPGVSDFDVFIKPILDRAKAGPGHRTDNKLNGYPTDSRHLPPPASRPAKPYRPEAGRNRTALLAGYDDTFEATRKPSSHRSRSYPVPARYPPDGRPQTGNSTGTPATRPTDYRTPAVHRYSDYQADDYDYPATGGGGGQTGTPPATTEKTTAGSRNTVPSRPKPLFSTPPPLAQSLRCDPYSCRLPDCRCGGTDVPGGLSAGRVPQIVLLTFDDAINDLNYDLYKNIFLTGRKNPNGCPILGTFYVSHEWTDYGQVQTLYSQGHEMASHSITHSYGEKFSKSQWYKEIQGQREILHKYGGVKLEDIRGMRAPFLQIGGNKMFDMLYEANFSYDASMPIFENSPPFWPYTLDYAINHECMIAPCPTKSYPGLWELGLVMWLDLRGGRCSMADACANPPDEEGVIKMLTKNFNRHYKTNKAPFGLFYHSAWFNTDHHRRGFLKFLDKILDKQDVWFVTNWQLVQWMRNPTPLDNLANFEPWQCDKSKNRGLPEPCPHPTVCSVWYQGGVRYMKTCQPCPTEYPWVSPEDKG